MLSYSMIWYGMMRTADKERPMTARKYIDREDESGDRHTEIN